MDNHPNKEEGKTSFLKRIHFTRSCSKYKMPKIQNWIVTVLSLTLFCLAINGFIENKIGSFLMIEKIFESSQEFLKQSLVTALGHFSALSVAKGGLAAISNTAPLGISIGKVVSPVSETVNFLWKIFGFSMISITAQTALLNFFKLISIKWIFSTGCLCLAYNFVPVFKRIGISLILISLVFYTLMPLSIATGKWMFEKNAQSANQALSENLSEFKNQVDSIKIFSLSNLNIFRVKETIGDIGSSLSSGLDVLVHSIIKYFSTLIIMLILTPLFFYTLIYLLIKYILSSVGMGKTAVILDAGLVKALKKSRV